MHSPGHSRGTDSRHQADLRGHEGTPRHGNLSSGGHLRTRRDTRGHATDTVRDREAPGSNPGPPTKKSYSNRGLHLLRLARGGHRRSQIFLELGGGSPVQVDFGPSIELTHGSRKADISARARPRDREAPRVRKSKALSTLVCCRRTWQDREAPRAHPWSRFRYESDRRQLQAPEKQSVDSYQKA